MTRPDNPALVYLDSCTLITAIMAQPGHEQILEILRLGQTNKLQLGISAVSYVEVRASGRRGPLDTAKDQEIIDRLDSPAFVLVEFNRHVALRARSLAQRHRLKNYDAIHLASAVEFGADVLMTSDAGFPLGTSVDGVWIDQPYVPGPPRLPGT